MLQVTCALIQNGDKFLIAQRSDSMSHSGLFEFPGGKIEPEETALACIRREILEELAVEIEVHNQLTPVEYHYPEKSICLIPFICTVKSGTPTLLEHSALAWVNASNISQYALAPADQLVWEGLRKWLVETQK